MFTQKFTKDQETWRRSRPEYARLLVAIRTDKPDVELVALADDAGTAGSEVVELKALRRRAMAPHRTDRAARYENCQKDMAALIAKIAEKNAELTAAKTPRMADVMENEIYAMAETRQRLGLVLADSRVAAACVQAAKTAGVV